MNVRVTGRTAKITLGKGIVDVSPGRRLTISNGVFEVPNTRLKTPPARVSFRIDGSVPAAAELLALDRLREFSGAPFDPATTKGTVTGQVQLGMPLRPDLPPGSTDYDITRRSGEFQRREDAVRPEDRSADRCASRPTTRATRSRATSRSRGAPAQIEFRRLKGESDAEVKLQATPRRGGAHAPRSRCRARRSPEPVPVKLVGRVGLDERRGPLQCRSRSHQHQDRESAAGLGQGAGPPGAAGLHPDQAEDRKPAARRSADRRAGRARQGHRRTRQRRRSAVGKLPGVRDLGRRQGLGARRPR